MENDETFSYEVSLREKCPYSELSWSECEKMRTRITSDMDTFQAVRCLDYSKTMSTCDNEMITDSGHLAKLINEY